MDDFLFENEQDVEEYYGGIEPERDEREMEEIYWYDREDVDPRYDTLADESDLWNEW
jgi:hypothetical protein